MKEILVLILFLSLILTGCTNVVDTSSLISSTYIDQTSGETYFSSEEDLIQTINGADISTFTIVFQSDAPEYTKNAAEYIQEQILLRTGVELNVCSDDSEKYDIINEIVVGETNREISRKLDAELNGVEFSLLSDGANVALEGNYFSIAGAAYYFINTYITGKNFSVTIPDATTVCTPIQKETKNYIIMIGDGMGVNHTKLFESEMSPTLLAEYTDGEDIFYGYLFPYSALSRTNSLTGTTDSAAGATALATGYKTYNGYIGMDRTGKPVPSIVELLGEKGFSTAVLTTDQAVGATPAAFTSHALDRYDSEAIFFSQYETKSRYNTKIEGMNYSFLGAGVDLLCEEIKETLLTLSENETGFFLMYEEAKIDKYSHDNDLSNTFRALLRFNQAISTIMEYVFYNPETMVIITADHETGGLQKSSSTSPSVFTYTSEGHTSVDVPVFVYGKGGEIFDNKTIENIQIPKTLAAFLGEKMQGYENKKFPALK